MSRLWENAEHAAPSFERTARTHLVDIRDDRDEQPDVSVRADGDDVVLTLPIDDTRDVEVTLSRDAAREIGAALDDASRQ